MKGKVQGRLIGNEKGTDSFKRTKEANNKSRLASFNIWFEIKYRRKR